MSDTERRTERISFRVSKSEYRQLKTLADREMKGNVSVLARQRILKGLNIAELRNELVKRERIAAVKKTKKAIPIVTEGRTSHEGLRHYAKHFLKNLGYRVFDAKGKVPDLIVCDHFGNLRAVEILTSPTIELVRKKVDQYVRDDIKGIIFVMPEKLDEIVTLFDEEFIDFISPWEDTQK